MLKSGLTAVLLVIAIAAAALPGGSLLPPALAQPEPAAARGSSWIERAVIESLAESVLARNAELQRRQKEIEVLRGELAKTMAKPPPTPPPMPTSPATPPPMPPGTP